MQNILVGLVFMLIAQVVVSDDFSHQEKDPVALAALAEQGDAAAQTALARLHLFGDADRRDANSAIDWLKKAVGNDYAPAQYLLGFVLVSDKKNTPGMQQGARYLMQSAKGGCAGASGLLGNLFIAASSRDASILPAAVAYIRQGAEGGDYMSQTLLAKLYSTGNAVLAQDLVAAYAWLAFSLADRPNHRLAKFSRDLQGRLREQMSAELIAQALEAAKQLKLQYARDDYGFCSQSVPPETLPPTLN